MPLTLGALGLVIEADNQCVLLCIGTVIWTELPPLPGRRLASSYNGITANSCKLMHRFDSVDTDGGVLCGTGLQNNQCDTIFVPNLVQLGVHSKHQPTEQYNIAMMRG